MRVGVTLSTFHGDPKRTIDLARTVEQSGLDGVFLFDHLWHIGQPDKPALHGPTLMGAVVSATAQITVGSLVARIGIQKAEVLVAMFSTLERMAPGRVVAGLGVGDQLSRRENEAYGIPFEPRQDRIEQMRSIARELRSIAVPVWIGGGTPVMWQTAAAEGDAVNLWNTPVAMTREAVNQAAPARVTWAGLERDEVQSMGLTAHLSAQAEAGAAWAIYAPVGRDSTLVDRLAASAREVGL